MSSPVPASFVVTLQPLASSNSSTSVAYCGHWTMLTAPSSLAFAWISSIVEPRPSSCQSPDALLSSSPPHPAARNAMAPTRTTSAARPRCFLRILSLTPRPPFPLVVRSHRCARAARPDAPGAASSSSVDVVEVLADDGQRATRVEIDDVARDRARRRPPPANAGFRLRHPARRSRPRRAGGSSQVAR